MGWQDAPVVSSGWASAPIVDEKPTPSVGELFKDELLRPVRALRDVLAGGVRGAGSIGATLLASPRQLREDFTGGPGTTVQREAMTSALGEMGADTESFAFGAGKLGGEIAGTMGVGNLLAAPLAGVSPSLASALASSGMRSGQMIGLAGMGTRAAGGAITGGVSAGLVSPGDAAGGAAIGAMLPGALQFGGIVGGAVGSGVRSVLSNQQTKGGREIAKALDITTAGDLQSTIAKLRAAKELVPGSTPTAAQALRTPQAGIVQRVVSDSAGGRALRDQLDAQNVARIAALEGVAPINPLGVASAQRAFGDDAAKFIKAGDAVARAKTSRAFDAVPQDEAMLYLPELSPIRDKYFGRAVMGNREAVDKAVSLAQDIGTDVIPGVRAARPGVQTQSLAQAVRQAGGLSIKNNDGLRGEIAGMRGEFKNLVRQNGGLSPDRMAEKMREAGFIGEESADALFEALKAESRGGRSFSAQNNFERGFSSMRDAAMGDAPEAASVAKKVTLRDLQDLRSSIKAEARGMAGKPEMARSKAALEEMAKAMDDRVNEVVRGDGAIDEVLPIDWANKLDEARKLKVEQVQQFRTGPQSEIFRMGSDGLPKKQGREVAELFWSQRKSAPEDVQALRKAIADEPKLLGQFRELVTTEGASTASAGGNLTSKFAKWVDNSLPALKEAFEPEQVRALRRIAVDIKRAEVAANKAMSRGSNTYQNAQNALNIGLLDNPMISYAANKVPLAGSGLNWLKDTAREAKGRRLAGLLSDAGSTADALSASSRNAQTYGLLSNPDLQSLILRGAPVAWADR
jgi:hypothetical protein